MKLLEKPTHGSVEWKMLRHRDMFGNVVFGASEIPALMGTSSFVSRAQLFASKRTQPEQGKETNVFRKGNLFEPVLIAEAANVLGINVYTPDLMYAAGRIVATLDGVDDALSPSLIVEAKTTTRYSVRTSDDLPNEWLWQAWAQQYATTKDGVTPAVWFAVLDSHQQINVVEAPNNPDALQRLADEAEAFARAIELNEPPRDFDDAIMDADTVAAIWKATEKQVEFTADQMLWVQELVRAKELEREAETLKKHAEDMIAATLKDCSIGTYNGVKVVSWKEQNGRTSLDTKAFREAHPDIFVRFERAGKPFRVMRTHRVSPD